MAVRKVALLVCSLAVLAGGCSAMGNAFRSIGLESRGSRLYRAEKAKNEHLVALGAENEARLAAAMTERDQLLLALADAKNRPTAPPTVAKTTANVDEGAKLARLREQLGSDAVIFVTPDGRKGLRVKGDLFFRSGKADVRPEARGVVGKIATALRGLGDVVVYVDGHTDSDPLRYTKKKYGDNYGLGAARASAVAKELVAMGVPRSQLVTRSFGKDRPIAENSTRAGKSKNRRVEFTVALNHNAAGAAKVSLDR